MIHSLKYSICVLFLVLSIAPKAQSPYTLIGTDQQASGVVAWMDDAGLGEKMQRIMEAWAMDDEFSGTVLVSESGKVVYSGAFGFANRSFDIPNTIDTKFMIGYISLHVVRYTIAKWIDEGKLKLDYPISKYLPELSSPHFTKITLSHLLNLFSGLKEDLEGLVDMNTLHTLDQLIEVIDNEPLVFEPGTKFSFGLTSSVLLIKLIENISAEPYQNYIHRTIIEPMNLKNTGFYPSLGSVKKLATHYGSLFGKKTPFSEIFKADCNNGRKPY